MGTDGRYTGGRVIATGHQSVIEATHRLLQIDPRQLAGLKVRAGEHLAAILTTTFLGNAPHAVDLRGDVDLRFNLPEQPPFPLSPGGDVAFEVKSMPGPFREFSESINRAARRGHRENFSIIVLVEHANDILSSAHPVLMQAQNALLRKAPGETSRNIFLVIHPFDRFALETYESPAIGAALAPAAIHPALDTLWVLWVPDHLTVWCTKDQTWTDLLFTGANLDEPPEAGRSPLAVLQEAESDFLAAVAGHSGYTDSPYLYEIARSQDPSTRRPAPSPSPGR
ncbi:hypothetical protein [Micromonospora rifamycinica]|uniref:hypothetical protein n=1 Tax=Micromonospora rifamycinica TaxID=291594 RepID=UPI0012FAC28E|nr:hypothetical protein [Micromonospora rifamycinica]